MIYDYYKEKKSKGFRYNILFSVILFLMVVAVMVSAKIYMEVIQLDEIGNLSSIYITNMIYRIVFSVISFAVIFAVIAVTNFFIKHNLRVHFTEIKVPLQKLPNFIIAFAISFVGAFLCRDFFYQKALNFYNSTFFGTSDPIFSRDIGYYVFQRPYLISIYDFVSSLWLFVILYTAAYYFTVLFTTFNNVTVQDLKFKGLLRHNLINLAVFFLIKTFSYRFQKEGILFDDFLNVTGAGYVDVNLWMKYYTIAPFLLFAIVAASFIFIWMGKFKNASLTIAVYPTIWVVITVSASLMQGFVVKPNAIVLENEYLSYNMQKTREAYKLNAIVTHDFASIKELTPEVLARNSDTVENIRIVDYQPTLDTNKQIQSNTNFYSFVDGDIINYNIKGKDSPVFISAREVDKKKLTASQRNYINTTFKYTHGYGVVLNTLNSVTAEGQSDFILSGLGMVATDEKLKVAQPRIYYGELTKDYVIVNPGNLNKLKEIDYDGTQSSSYEGKGGISLTPLNRLLFSLKNADINMIISNNVISDSRLLLNRDVVFRAQKAVPFLSVDTDPYIIITDDGKLKWVLDAYTTSSNYPYSQSLPTYGDFNYIRNSVKIVVDAYDGDVKYYIIDKSDPMINTYKKIYPGIFSEEQFPQDIASHMRYPELLFKIQTEMLKRYHLDPQMDPENVNRFFTGEDLWEIAKYPKQTNTNSIRTVDSSNSVDIDPYYNMIKLPDKFGKSEELILMRPFTPSGSRHNMVSWLAVRNSDDNYGEMILFNFPKNMNILGTDQVEVNINQTREISEYTTLWGQKGSRVFKGSLLVIPIEESILYVEPLYIQSESQSSIPQVRKIIVGYQKGNDFKAGIGDSLNDAINNLFKDVKPPTPQAPQTPGTTSPNAPAALVPPAVVAPGTGTNAGQEKKTDEERLVNEIITKYDTLKKQLDDLGNLIKELKK